MTAQAKGPLLDIDEGRLAEMLAVVGPSSETRLLRSLIDDLQKARAGLERAIEQRNAVDLRNHTHVLAALAATFGAMSLSAAAQELEVRSLSAVGVPDGSLVIAQTEWLTAFLTARLAGPRT